MTSKSNFSLDGYKTLINGLMSKGYKASSFRSVGAAYNHLILRHDVDMSLEAALKIAELENNLGVSSQYFVLLRTEMYNLFSDRGLSILNKIMDLGHNIGLHFDSSIYRESEIEEAAAWEVSCLQAAIKKEIDMISFHRPVKKWLGCSKRIAGLDHTYQPRWFTEMLYVSDSRGGWHYGYPLDLRAVQENKSLQLLTHPIWWFETSEDTVTGRLNNFIKQRDLKLREQVALNCEPYRAFKKKPPENDK